MSFHRRILMTALLAVTVLATGCATVNKATPEADSSAKAFRPNQATSQVYVYRNEMLGAALSMPVTVNGKLIGATGAKTFFKLDLPAGKHTLTSQGDTSKLELVTEAGKLYFVWQEVKMGGFSGGSKLQLVTEAVGKQGVQECSLAQTQP
jgi:Protein of unknown function (DUF2846)